ALFETAAVFLPSADPQGAPLLAPAQQPTDEQWAQLNAALPAQPLHAAGVLTGRRTGSGWWGTGEPVTAVRLVGADLARAHPGRRAVPVRLPDPGMVTLLEVGDLIDLLATDPEQGNVSTVAHAVPVLALPRDDEAGSGVTASGLSGRLVIVALAPAEVAPVTAAALRAFVTYTWSER
ncbi:MAG: hypothetical protein CMJ44_19645, partial [Pimelobacter sp.]|nr:hypothetical protein [Pimelobacter sp.]